MKEDKGNKFQDAKVVIMIIYILIIFFRLNPSLIPFVLRVPTEPKSDFHDCVSEICWGKGFRPKLFIIKKITNLNLSWILSTSFDSEINLGQRERDLG